VFNIGKATVKGIEGQIQVNSNGFIFDGGFAYVKSNLNPTGQMIDIRKYTGGANLPQCTTAPGVVPALPTGCVNYAPFLINTTSGPNLYSPNWSWNASLAYRFQTGSVAITPRVNYSYIGPQFTYIAYDPVRDKIAGRGLLSASVNVEVSNVVFEVYGTNLTKKVYAIGQNGARGQFYGAPREFGARVKASF
jgi:iron complex outermembrane receptor protein